jgi:hypothetical protein
MTDKLSMPVPVKFSEVLDALDFVSVGDSFDHLAYICISTGTVHWVSDALDLEEEALPDDVEESDDYVAVPHRRELDLGSKLVFAFAEQVMPDDYDTVRDIFRKRGAYGRLKEFLASTGMLQKWYDFETKTTEAVLRAWCRENGIVLEDELTPGA